jgi:hypothetical protein
MTWRGLATLAGSTSSVDFGADHLTVDSGFTGTLK